MSPRLPLRRSVMVRSTSARSKETAAMNNIGARDSAPARGRFEMKRQRLLLSIAAALVAATLGADALGAEESRTVLSPQALKEIAQVEAEIDSIEARAIERLAVPPDNQVQQIELLGKLMLYDRQLSVNRNEACAF